MNFEKDQVEKLEMLTWLTVTLVAIRGFVKVNARLTVPNQIAENFYHWRRFRGQFIKVNDSDNVRFVHQPFFARLYCFLFVRGSKAKLEFWGKGLNIRIAGIDAPEMARYGKQGQPFSQEAKDALKALVSNKRGYIVIHSMDIYGRPVASTFVLEPRGLLPFMPRRKTHVGLYLVKTGLACVYEGKGAEYGGFEKELRLAEAEAKKYSKGMWSLGSRYVSPMEFKRRAATASNPPSNNDNCDKSVKMSSKNTGAGHYVLSMIQKLLKSIIKEKRT